MMSEMNHGVVLAAHPNASFTVLLRGDRRVRATLAGKLRASLVRCGEGDLVAVEPSPFDRGRGRITARLGHFDAATGLLQQTPRQP